MGKDIRRWRLLREGKVSVKDMDKASKEGDLVRKQRRKSVKVAMSGGGGGSLSRIRKKVGCFVGSVTGSNSR